MYNPNLKFHFTGIGGSGMSGLAEILLCMGFRVSGSDANLGEVCQRLISLGAQISEGHSKDFLPENTSVLVYSSAISEDNPERAEARRRSIPEIRRAEVLAELMRLRFGVGVAGSHGKTTTTTMIAEILESAGVDPTVVIGGIVHSIGSGSKLGKSQIIVAESDESDQSFLLLKPCIAVVTNIDTEHLVAYDGSVEKLEAAFENFINSVPFYGLSILCIDDKRVNDLAKKYKGRLVTYGFSSEADVQAKNFETLSGKSIFTLCVNGTEYDRIELAAPGRHLVSNCLAAISVCLEFGVSITEIRKALSNLRGVGRRLEVLGEKSDIIVIDDYAHHPTEIRASLNAIKENWGERSGKIRLVYEPHRYSRTRDAFNDFIGIFADADSLVLTSTYPASEKVIEGFESSDLFCALDHPDKHYVDNLDEALLLIEEQMGQGDLVVFMGAGKVSSYAHRFYNNNLANFLKLAVEPDLVVNV